MKVALREDGLNLFKIDLATAKAATSLGFGRSTLDLARAPNHEAARTPMLSAATGGRLIAIGGGVPAIDREGQRIGAAGLSGGPHGIDHGVVVGAVRAVGLRVRVDPV